MTTTNTRNRTRIVVTLCVFALLVCSGNVNAGLISDTATYSYTLAPGFSGGGGLYLDDIAGTTLGQLNTPFAAGDLNDGVVYNGTNPVTDGGGVNSMLAWDPANPTIPATITFDLGSLYNVTEVTVTSYAWSAFALGAPDDVTISYSTDNVTYGAGTLYTWPDGGDGAQAHATGASTSGARYVRLAFDGDSTLGAGSDRKWGLTEIEIEGTAVPEPATFILAALSLLGLGFISWRGRRR